MHLQKTLIKIFGFVLSMITIAAYPAYSQITIVPEGLKPGDSLRLIFVTDGTIAGNLTSIEEYNTFATSQANSIEALKVINTQWSAVISHRDTNGKYTRAVENTEPGNTETGNTVASAGIYNFKGERVAANTAALWLTKSTELTATVNVTQSGVEPPSNQVWTGSEHQGKPGGKPLGQTNPSGAVARGSAGTLGAGWLNAGSTPGTELRPIYVISDVLWIPEPSVIP